MSLYTMPCVVFAGGKSSRMGENKALLPFVDHKSLIDYQVQRLQKVFKNVYISAKDKGTYSEVNAEVIEDTYYREISAPITGIFNVFNYLQEDSFFILSVDAPFVDESLIAELLEKSKGDVEAVIAKTPSGTHPLCGVYNKELLEPLEKMIQENNYKLKDLLNRKKVYYVDVKKEGLLSNLNTPSQYKEALKFLKQEA